MVLAFLDSKVDHPGISSSVRNSDIGFRTAKFGTCSLCFEVNHNRRVFLCTMNWNVIFSAEYTDCISVFLSERSYTGERVVLKLSSVLYLEVCLKC